MEVIKTAHTVYRLQYHVVWVTKYRRRILNPGVSQYLKKTLSNLLRSMPGVTLEQIGFDNYHLHLCITIPPKYSIASVMGGLKSQSASQLRNKLAWLKDVYWKENIVWSPGYFVSSIGLDEKIIRNYVEMQGRQDSGQLRMQL